MLPNDYYAYNEGELMSMSVNDVVYTDTSSNQNSHPIPQSIQNLDGYGWSAGNAYNYVDFENRKYYKCVNKVDLGTLEFAFVNYNEELYGFRCPKPEDIKSDLDEYKKRNNLLCYKYLDTPWNDAYLGTDKSISLLSNAIHINDSSYSDLISFKNALQGVYLYYELAEPIVTDISELIGDTFQEPFEVETGGSLTFKNTNGDGYRIAVPSDIQYTVALSEVNA